MKLHIDCDRDVLLYLEENFTLDEGKIIVPINVISLHKALPDYSENDIFYTCKKLDETYLIEFNVTYAGNAACFSQVSSLTHTDHQFLETIRSDKVFSKTKSILSKIGNFTFDVPDDSMMPLILDGDIAFIKGKYDKTNNEIYAVNVDSKTYIKRIIFETDKLLL